MRLTAIFLLAACLQVSANGFSQKVTLTEKNIPLRKLFKEINKQTGYQFFLKDQLLRGAHKVDVDVKDAPLEQVLINCFRNQPFTYTIIEKAIIIKEKPQPGNNNEPVTEVSVIEVHGTVKDENGKPLAGASVKLKGTDKGTTTDANGNFLLQIPDKGGKLVISYVGYETLELAAPGSGEITAVLKPAESKIEEVIVVGYGTQKRQAITGSVAKANLQTYQNVTSNNILDMVKGTLPGVNIGATNTAGAVPGISIRGQNSISAGTSPLIVVDDIIFKGSLNDIPPADIESFVVLKDASAAAVYGSRSSNGVVIITTKKGRGLSGKPLFNVSTTYGRISELKKMQVADTALYMKYIYDQRMANGSPVTADLYTYMQPEEIANYLATPDHAPTVADPYSLFRQTGQEFNTNISVSNRINKTSYYISGNYTRQKGVIINDLYKNYAARVNLQTDLASWFTVGVNSYYSLKDYPASSIYGTQNDGGSYYNFSPWASIKDSTGAYIQFPQTTTSFNSRFWMIPTEAYNRQNTLNGILTATIKFPWIKGLSYNFAWSNNLNWNESGSFYGLQTVAGNAV